MVYQREADIYASRELLQASIFSGAFYLHAGLSPFLPATVLPDPQSPWFPLHLFPESVDIAFPSRQTLTLKGIEIIPAEDEPFSLDSISAMVEAGYSFPGADISALYFRGWDPEFNAKVSASFPTGLYDGYIVNLTETRSIIQAAGLSFASSIESFRFWIDLSYTFDKPLRPKKISVAGTSVPLTAAGYLRYTPGISYEFSRPQLTLAFEYKGDAIFQSENGDLRRPLFSRLAALVLKGNFLDSRLTPSLAALVSIEDGSFAVLPKVSYRPSDAVNVLIHSPFFFGPDDTELGQFARNHLLSIRLIGYF